MRLRSIPYFWKQAVANISKNRVVHVVGISTMVISLLILGAFLLLFLNVNNWLQGWGRDLTMSVYLQDGVSEARRQEIASALNRLPSAEIERYVSKEQALSDFKHALGAQAGLLEGLSSNPLPASFELVFHRSSDAEIDPEEVKGRLEGIEGVGEVQYSQEWIRRFEGLMGMVKAVGFVLGGLLCLCVLFIVTNTIKLTIYSRQEEIEILKLVGATDWFIKIPFLLEGALQGILAGSTALLFLYGGYFLLSLKEMPLLGLAVLDFSFLPLEYSLSIFALSVLLGMTGSFIAIGRFFKL